MPLGNTPEAARMIRLGRALMALEKPLFLRARPEEWMDAMIERLLLHCEQQFETLKATTPGTPAEQVQCARTLGQIERTLTNLARTHASQRLTREQKVAMSDDEIVENIARRLDRLADAAAAPQLAQKSVP